MSGASPDRRFVASLLALLVVALQPPSSASALRATGPSATWRIYPLNQNIPAALITFGLGAAWFTSPQGAGSFGRISRGRLRVFDTPGVIPIPITTGGGKIYMSAGSGGEDWILAYSPKTQELTVYPANGRSGDNTAGQLVWLPTGDVWFSESHHIARLTPHGRVVEYRVKGTTLGSLMLGPDGKLWFMLAPRTLARIDPVTHRTSRLTLPADQCTDSSLPSFSLTNGALDGTLYVSCFTYVGSAAVTYFYRVETGAITVYGPFLLRAYGIAGARDGRIYVADGYPNALAFFDPKKDTIGYYYTPNHDGVGALTVGPEGNVWCIMGPTPAVGELVLHP